MLWTLKPHQSQENKRQLFWDVLLYYEHNINASFTKHPKYWEFVFLWLSECDKLVQSRLMYITEVCCLISGILIDVANIWSQDWVVVTRQEMVLFSLISEAIATCHNTRQARESWLPWQPSHRFISTGRGLSFAVITDVFRTHTYWSVSYKWVVYFHTGCFSIGLLHFSTERPDSKPLCFPQGFGISSCRESDKTVVYKDTHTLNMPIFTLKHAVLQHISSLHFNT